ncbi:MAG: DUF1559 domain-containing protein [Planctomycetaceae bacterium]|jgi:hypothetical protein|nr:DUF1559 domain-containing protein [Planctomycetaceae bacterium]
MKRHAFTLTELVTIILIALLVAGLFFPAVLASRETARRKGCENRLRALGVALNQYNDVHSVLPCHKFGTGSQGRISAFTILLPHIGYENVYNDIVEAKWQVPWRKEKVGADGKVVLDDTGQPVPGPYCTIVSEFLCPSDSVGLERVPLGIGYNNYVVSHGDWITGLDEKFSRGVFAPGVWRTLDDIVDGASHTIAMSERCAATKRDSQIYSAEIRGATADGVQEVPERISIRGGVRLNMSAAVSEDVTKQNPQLCVRTAVSGYYVGDENVTWVNREWCGSRWADAMHIFTTASTILPPNSPSCAAKTKDETPLLAPPTSYHAGGACTLMLDGQVCFVSDKIDCGGDYTGKTCVKEGESPFGIWGAMGCIADSL